MAILENNGMTVGPWPLPATLKRSDILGNLFIPGSLVPPAYELRPIPFDKMGEALANGDIATLEDYVSPYATYTLTAKAIPSLPDEVILSCSFKPPAWAEALGIFSDDIRPFKVIVEEPNPGADASRTASEDPVIIEPPLGGLWDAPGSEETTIQTFDSGPTATLVGYYTEKAFYDREWYLRFSNCIARFSYLGIQYIKTDDVPQGIPLDLQELFSDPKIAKTLPSDITYNNWYPQTKADAQAFDSPHMSKYFGMCDGIVSYKATEIRKLRYYYIVFIESLIGGATIPTLTWFPCFMTVQYNSNFAQQRLAAAIAATQAADRTPLPLPIPTNA
tara:strand:- start:541 stop:1539 length:999 start_codon:yes stop_codon:yes gene_type:complete